MNPIEFMQRWSKGIRTLGPEELLKAKMTGHIGAAIGLVLAIINLWFRDVKSFTVFLIFMIWLQVVEYLSAKKKFINIKCLSELEEFEKNKRVM